MPASPALACGLTLVAWRLTDLTPAELWWRYVALGGDRAPHELADYLGGIVEWPAWQHNVLAQTLNERLWDLGCPSLAPHRHPESHPRELRPRR